jgi:tungstate transport system permease protein
MDYIFNGLIEAARLILSGNTDVFSAVGVTLQVSLVALAISALFAVPLGLAIGARPFAGQGALITLFNSLVGLPTVVVGLVGYAFLSRQGLAGSLNLLFTKTAIICGEVLLAFPIIVTGTIAAIKQLDRRVIDTSLTLGADRRQLAVTMLEESRFAILASIVLGLGRCLSEVGAAMILGGNIRGETRTITTAITLESSKGEFATAIALGLILISLSILINIILRRLQNGGMSRRVFR